MEETEHQKAKVPAKRNKGLLISIVVAVLVVAGAFILKSVLAARAQHNGKGTFTIAQLSAYDGKNGHACYVAVDGTVYKIDQGRLWQNGEHTSSEGKASCGRDLSQAIKQSPHGKSKLSTLEVVGTLK
ncbi:MAG TPA: hypothetical protein VLE73_02585 [Candidatus Saccharimonadales bacterium]|nr:hypothetical protein [Candidatus Saccharimonadales bacterium]